MLGGCPLIRDATWSNRPTPDLRVGRKLALDAASLDALAAERWEVADQTTFFDPTAPTREPDYEFGQRGALVGGSGTPDQPGPERWGLPERCSAVRANGILATASLLHIAINAYQERS